MERFVKVETAGEAVSVEEKEGEERAGSFKWAFHFALLFLHTPVGLRDWGI